ncbi:MAG: T9SS type A sorting domain-containing protein [Bacteroidota bacterium]
MKKFLVKATLGLVLLVCFGNKSFAQAAGTLWQTTVRYNCVTELYEVYARPTQARAGCTPPPNTCGNYILASTVTVILPIATQQLTDFDVAVNNSNTFFPRSMTNFNSAAPGWAVTAGTLGSNGYYVTVDCVNGGRFESDRSLVIREYLLFTFSLTNGCNAGVRMWTPGDNVIIAGSDYKSTIVNQNNVEQFASSYNNTGTICGISDFGDLASTWPQAKAVNLTACNGTNDGTPETPAGAVWAGAIVDGEASQAFSATATGDDSNGLSDEDGLVGPAQPVAPGYTYNYAVTLNSNQSLKQVFYGMWFDYNNNGSFTDDVDGNGLPAFYSGSALTGSPVTVQVPVRTPQIAPNPLFKVRLIVSDVAVTSTMFGATIANGEIEDYQAPALILPVSFGSVTATAKNCNIYLAFDYLTQQNNKEFRIEYSTNGTNWMELALLPNTGNLSSQSFSYVHTSPVAGVNYYRIKQVDKDGNFSYSKTVNATSTCDGRTRIVSYPNPVSTSLTVVLPLTIGKSQLRITDAAGKLISSTTTQNSFNTINTQMLASGMYMLQVVNANKIVYSTKFVKE